MFSAFPVLDYTFVDLYNKTSNVYRTLGPEIKENKIKIRTFMIVGTMGMGKTTLFLYVTNKLAKKYLDQKKSINVIISQNISDIFRNINDADIQFLFLDDSAAGDSNQRKAEIGRYTIIRHIFKQRRMIEGKDPTGLIIFSFAVQDYFLLNKKIRNTMSVIGLMHSPTNPFDVRSMKGIFGESAMNHLEKTYIQVIERDNLKALSKPIIRVPSGVGYMIYENIEIEDLDFQVRVIESAAFQAIQEKEIVKSESEVSKETLDSEFNSVLLEVSNQKLRSEYSDKTEYHLEAFSRYYFDKPRKDGKPKSYEDIKDEMQLNVNADSVGDAVRSVKYLLAENTKLLGDILEISLKKKLENDYPYLHTTLSAFPDWLRDQKDESKGVDLLIEDDEKELVVINCKVQLEARASYQIRLTPECYAPESLSVWVALVTRGFIAFIRIEDREEYLTVKIRDGVSYEEFCQLEDFEMENDD